MKETSHSFCGLGIYHLTLTFLAIKEFKEHLTVSERGWGDGSGDKVFSVQSWGLEFCILEKRFPQIKMKPHSFKVRVLVTYLWFTKGLESSASRRKLAMYASIPSFWIRDRNGVRDSLKYTNILERASHSRVQSIATKTDQVSTFYH